MKVMTILGTRPELIRLAIIIKRLDKYSNHILVHTGQNYTKNLNNIFFEELGIRKPDYFLGIREEYFGQQVGRILMESEKVLMKEKPDALLILGDTNSGLSSIIAKRLGITVFHMEAGNRCYDDRVPEEVNRRLIDNATSIWMPYTQRSKENLMLEGKDRNKIYVIGNPIYEIIEKFKNKIDNSRVLKNLEVEKNQYFLCTIHRAENVDIKERLVNIIKSLKKLNAKYKLPVICSLHPRTKSKMKKFKITVENKNIRFLEPLGLFDFVKLEKHAFCVLTDSGTVQEECCIFNIPNVTIRDVTERPETVECGSNIIASVDPSIIERAVLLATGEHRPWPVPEEYIKLNVSDTVTKIILGFNYYK